MADYDSEEIEQLKRRCDQLVKKIEKLELNRLEYADMEKNWEEEKHLLEHMLRTKTGELAILSEKLNRKY